MSDNADDRSVQLSSDVLFAVNKADLTPRADALLRQVAQQINASKGSTVKVDGHADSTGDDAINEPLSERRAQAVVERLKGLVTRQGIAFQAAGHGSSQPIASNDSDEGRRKNRRVAVSFTRPIDAAAPAAAGEPYRSGDKTALRSGRIEQPRELEFTVNSLHRGASGLAVLVWTIKNTGAAEASVEHLERNITLHGSAPRNRGWATGGVMLVDPATKTRYWPLETSVGHCQCYTFTPKAKTKLAPGESVVLWGVYKPPARLRAVDLHIPWDHQVGATATGLTIA
ncbi:OmpA family protein [Spirillospora albida]|uniref:OmpA family protein n=1 Tax=Spirillospora albida TaxID=58123 RepID=UPI001FE09B1C|nr:OmpA family protein [Spirillospora albida]